MNDLTPRQRAAAEIEALMANKATGEEILLTVERYLHGYDRVAKKLVFQYGKLEPL